MALNISKFFGYGLVAAGVALVSLYDLAGALLIGMGIGYSIHPFIQKVLNKSSV